MKRYRLIALNGATVLQSDTAPRLFNHIGKLIKEYPNTNWDCEIWDCIRPNHPVAIAKIDTDGLDLG